MHAKGGLSFILIASAAGQAAPECAQDPAAANRLRSLPLGNERKFRSICYMFPYSGRKSTPRDVRGPDNLVCRRVVEFSWAVQNQFSVSAPQQCLLHALSHLALLNPAELEAVLSGGARHSPRSTRAERSCARTCGRRRPGSPADSVGLPRLECCSESMFAR